MKSITYFVLFCVVIYAQVSFGQAHYFNKYDGIPIIAHTNLTSEQLVLKPTSLQKMEELGIFGFYATNLNPSRYSYITNNYEMRLFPYQLSWNTEESYPPPFIAHYTNGVYSIWLAGGNGNEELGNIKINYDTSLAELRPGGIGIITKANASAGHLLEGPYYYQAVKSKVYGQDIFYTANFRMKIDRVDPNGSLPENYENDLVCKLQVVATRISQDWEGGPIIQYDTVVYSKDVLVEDFKNANNVVLWDVWKRISTAEYTLDALNRERQAYFGESLLTGSQFSSEYMQYKVYWMGLPYLKLCVDTIIISDRVGKELFYTLDAGEDILDAVEYYSDTNRVLGWHGIGEPSSIDNYLCFRKVNEIIHEQYPQLDIFTSLAGASNGRYTWKEFYKGVNHPSIYPGYEFIKRSGLNYLSINLYNYNYPYIPPPGSGGYVADPNYRELNVQYVADSNLVKIVDAGIPISYSSQSGRFYDWGFDENTLSWKNIMYNHINPTFEEMNYHINLGLLFGAKELTCDPVFTIWDTTANQYYREGLIDFESTSTPLTYLGIHFREIINPRLSGLMGKTLRKLNQDEQETGINLRSSNYSDNYIDSIRTNARGSDTSVVDIGLFSDSSNSDKKYLMLLSRWYNTNSADRYTFLFKTYRNWVIYDYIDSLNRGSSINTNNKGYFEDTISTGDARLYRIYPVVKYGGELNYDETVTNESLSENDLIVKNGATLTINGTYNCNKSILVDTGGKLKIIEGATLNFSGGAKLIVRGRLTAKGDNSPITFNFGEIDADPANGIVLQESSYDTLINCKILNAHTGIKIDATTPYIDFCEITNSQNGMVLVDTYYDVENDTGTIIKEMQITNCATGIHMESSSAFLSENHTDSCIVGIRCVDGSFPIFGEWNQVGLNRITGEDTGAVAVKSGIILGMAGNPLFAGYNDCLSENILINASEESYVYGNYVWWGMADSTFDKGKFVTDEGSYIDYDYYLNESATGYGENRFRVNQLKQQVLTKEAEEEFKENNLTLREEFREAIRHYQRGEGTEARSICRRIIQNNRDSVIALTALRLIANTINTPIIRDSVRTYLTQEGNSPANNIDFIVNSKVILAELDGTDYIESINAIISRYPNTREKDYLLYKKFSYYYFRENKRDSALSILSEMETAFPEGIYTKIAKELIEGNKL